MHPIRLTLALVLSLATVAGPAFDTLLLEKAAQAAPQAKTAQELAALFSSARRKYEAKSYDESIALFEQYLKALPKSRSPLDNKRARAHHRLAWNHAGKTDYQKAYEHLRKAINYGFWNERLLQVDPVFESVRRTKDYRDILKLARTGKARMAFGRRDLNGKLVDGKKLEGKVLIVDVWGTWCPPCRAEIPHFIELQKKYSEHGLQILGVTYEKREPSPGLRREVKNYAESRGINYPCVLADSELINTAGVNRYPTTFFIDHEGNIAKTFIGAQSLFTLETEAVKLLNKKIVADSKKKKKKTDSNEPTPKK
ncbi:MAG: TlpA disulfide reductase family protein [Planctomycetota bacterium]